MKVRVMEAVNGLAVSVRVDLLSANIDSRHWERTLGCFWDVHLDHPDSDITLFRRHLALCAERQALLIAGGDTLDVMQSRGDPRARLSDLRPGLAVEDYYDAVLDHAAEQMAGHPWVLVMAGNHELSARRHHHRNLTLDLAKRLDCVAAANQCWLTVASSGFVFTIYLDHGDDWPGGSVTRGIARADQMAASFPCCDAYVSNHIHRSWSTPSAYTVLNKFGRRVNKDAIHVCAGTYKRNTDPTAHKSKRPVPLGGMLLRLSARREAQPKNTRRTQVTAEQMPAF